MTPSLWMLVIVGGLVASAWLFGVWTVWDHRRTKRLALDALSEKVCPSCGFRFTDVAAAAAKKQHDERRRALMADAMKRGVKLRLDLSAWWFDCPECGEYLTFVLDGFHLAVDEARREREASWEPTA